MNKLILRRGSWDELRAANAVDSGNDNIRVPHLQHRMGLGVDRNGHGLATIAQIKVGAFGVHALESHTLNRLLARVASRVVSSALSTIEATLEVKSIRYSI